MEKLVIFSYSVEGAFRFSDEMGSEEFMELISRRLDELDKDVSKFDEGSGNKKQTKNFLVKSTKRLNELIEVVDNLRKEKDLLEEISESFLLETDGKIQMVRKLLQMKKMNPDQMSILSQSICRSEHEEEIESLIGDKTLHEGGGIMKIDLETSVIRDRRLRKIEDKFEYVNMMCADLNQMVIQQTECIKSLDGNFGKACENTFKAKQELNKVHLYQEQNSRKVCAILIILLIVAIATLLFFRAQLIPRLHSQPN